MSSNNDGNTSSALTHFDRKTLAETRKYAKTCGNKIAEDKTNFADKSALGLWWDAKGLFNSSDAEEVTAHMERYRKFYEEMDTFSAQVEKGDPKSYERLLRIYEEIEEMERGARRDVENNQSSAICQMLREFLNKKYNLDHNLKKVECIVLRQKMSDVKQSCKSFEDKAAKMDETMDKLIEENRAVRRESDEKLRKLIEENCAVRQESNEKLSKLIEENRGIKGIVEQMRKEKEELASEAEKHRHESNEMLQHALKEAEERAKARLQKMEEENEKLRLESERIRQESDERLKQAVEDANRRSEARMQEMAEQNRANLQKMTKMLEAMNIP